MPLQGARPRSPQLSSFEKPGAAVNAQCWILEARACSGRWGFATHVDASARRGQAHLARPQLADPAAHLLQTCYNRLHSRALIHDSFGRHCTSGVAGRMLRTMQVDARAPVSAPDRSEIDRCIRCVATSRAPPAPKAAKLSNTRQHLEQSLEQPAARVAPTQTAETSSAAQSSITADAQAVARQKGRHIILLDGDCLQSTPEHRRIVGSGLALMGGLLAVGASQVHDAPSAAAAAAAAASGYLVAGERLAQVKHTARMRCLVCRLVRIACMQACAKN